jgi:hypothetical protein
MVEGVEDEIALDVGYGAADETAGGDPGGLSGLGGYRATGELAESGTVGHGDGFGTDDVPGGEEHRSMECVLEFTDVTRPRRAEELLLSLCGKTATGEPVRLGIFRDEELAECRDVQWALTERREL